MFSIVSRWKSNKIRQQNHQNTRKIHCFFLWKFSFSFLIFVDYITYTSTCCFSLSISLSFPACYLSERRNVCGNFATFLFHYFSIFVSRKENTATKSHKLRKKKFSLKNSIFSSCVDHVQFFLYVVD